MRLCSGPGCGRKVPDGTRFCDECAGDKQVQKPRTSMQRAADDPLQLEYLGARWKKLRRPVLLKHPMCQECRAKPSAVVDHNVPAVVIVRVCRALRLFVLQQWPGFYILENLRALCHGCHNSKTKREDAQDWSGDLVRVLARFLPQHMTELEREDSILAAYRNVQQF